MSGVQSFERELGILFERWLAEVELRLGHPVDRDAAFEAWIQGYSTAEYAERAEVSGALR